MQSAVVGVGMAQETETRAQIQIAGVELEGTSAFQTARGGRSFPSLGDGTLDTSGCPAIVQCDWGSVGFERTTQMPPRQSPDSVLTQLSRNLWVYEEPLRFLGTRINRIMAVIRLADGRLFIQSPAKLTAEVTTALAELGDVKFVAPTSKLHGHLYMEQYRAAYPDVELLAAPGLPARRPDLRFDGLLGSTPDPRWSTDIDQTALMGNWWITELAFYHRPSKTVILGDMGYHITENSSIEMRLLGRLGGIYKRIGQPLEYKLTIRNEDTLRQSVRTVLAWDFDRVIPGHGDIIESGGNAAVQDGFRWLLE
jgi:hypothetical protein